jgi:hypothetical protein
MAGSLQTFKNIHQGADIIVCGCGESLNTLVNPERFVTIGVNDIGRLFHPDYLVVVNPPRQFSAERFHYVESSRARYLFTQLDLGTNHPNVVRFQLGAYGGTDLGNSTSLNYTQNSPYVAVCLAALMGACRIGLIGVDFTENHFFGKTGRHPLASRLPRINAEYRLLREALQRQGIQVYNLSTRSRLTAFEFMSLDAFAATSAAHPDAGTVPRPGSKRIFFVHYKFLSCGDVFSTGLQHAAESLGVVHTQADWDDISLPDKVSAFQPDLLFVVHGRKFGRKWGKTFENYNTAVWLLDEPYEVDDTSRYSGIFRHVFVNDPGTLGCHHNCHYLPVCYDPRVHFPGLARKEYAVGFVGGHNATREKYLRELYRTGLLSYVVGGPWRDQRLNGKSLSKNLVPESVAELYRQTRIVVNVFRDIHHYNRDGISATSMNPRIYESLACGALVVSERRSEIEERVPEMPVFSDTSGLVDTIHALLVNDEQRESLRQACVRRLAGHTYCDRLKKALSVACEQPYAAATGRKSMHARGVKEQSSGVRNTPDGLDEWEEYGGVATRGADGVYDLRKDHEKGPGTERGLVSRNKFRAIDLSAEVNIEQGACFVAKVHQSDRYDQTTDSYHVMCNGSPDYLARHDHVFATFALRRDAWEQISISVHNHIISLFREHALIARVYDRRLDSGFAFLGIKGGRVRVRNIRLNFPSDVQSANPCSTKHGIRFSVIHSSRSDHVPAVSIVTTVYDRVDCLRECIRSVKSLHFGDYEQIIVADAPGNEVAERIHALVETEDTGRITFALLEKRHNNWGIAPAAVGLHLACGKYVCFLSDDNGYQPDHFDHLMPALERDPALGFAYSSCRYGGRRVLNFPPAPGKIDLGQPLFRSDLFDRYLDGGLPFHAIAWDWQMIETFLEKAVKYHHVDLPTFLFRLAECRQQVTA